LNWLIEVDAPISWSEPYSRVEKQGFIVEDNTGRRVFFCSSHVQETLNAFLTTPRMVAAEA
jgi:hypothetical protein